MTPQIVQHNYRGRRWYTIEGYDGEFINATGVLSIIAKPALIPWANKQGRLAVTEYLTPFVGQELTQEALDAALAGAKTRPDEVKQGAADYGTLCHNIIEQLIKGERPEIPEAVEPTIAAFYAWRAQAGLFIDLAETMVYSATYRYAGTMDACARRGTKLVALDWKSSAGIYDEAAAQLSAYAHAWEEMTGETVDEGWVVRFGKDKPEFEAKQVELAPAFEMFLAALSLTRASKQGLWHIPDKEETIARGEAAVEALWGT